MKSTAIIQKSVYKRSIIRLKCGIFPFYEFDFFPVLEVSSNFYLKQNITYLFMGLDKWYRQYLKWFLTETK